MMLLAATLSAATRTKSGPCIPIKYSILYNSYEPKDFYKNLKEQSSPFLVCADYTAKVRDGCRGLLSSPEKALARFQRDSGGQFERTAVVVSAVL